MKCKELEDLGFVQANDSDTQFKNIYDMGQHIYEDNSKIIVVRNGDKGLGRLSYGKSNSNEPTSWVDKESLDDLLNFISEG